jgi:hypothetical protein
MADTPTPEQVALVRRRYQDGAPLKAIMAESGVKTLYAFYRCLQGKYPDGTGVDPASIQLRKDRRAVAAAIPPTDSRAAVVERMWRTAELQVGAIEERLEAAGIELVERESHARTVALVARTLRELKQYDKTKAANEKKPADDIDDDPVPRDIDEFRRELARRIRALVESRTNPGGVGTS